MEVLRRGSGSPAVVTGVVAFMFLVLVMVPEVSAKRWIVGSNMGWTSNVNYTIWARDKHFYNGDWLCKFNSSLSMHIYIYMCVYMYSFLFLFLSLHGFGLRSIELILNCSFLFEALYSSVLEILDGVLGFSCF